MISAKTLIRKSFRIILWITLMLVFLFIAVALLIQLPAIQTKIVQQATTFVSKKTHTLVELEKVSISFPKTVIVEGLYLEDTQKDTLIYARRAKVNMALIDLLSGKITINAVMLNDATVNLYNFHDSPEFNYNFLTTAFSDTTAEVKTDTLTKTGMAFSLNKVSLRNFRLLYNDNYAAMNVTIGIKKSDFNVDQIDLGKSIYQIDQLQLDGLTALVGQTPTNNPSTSDSSKAMPNIFIQELELTNANIQYTDSVGFMSVMALIDRLKLEKGQINLETEQLGIATLKLSKSDIRYHDFAPEPEAGTINATTSNNWKVGVERMDMDDNSFIYKVGDEPDKPNEFNATHLAFKNLSLEAGDFYYDKELTKISVRQFKAIDQNDFVISKLACNFSMDKQTISTQALKLETPHSTIDADFSLHFQSLDQFLEHYQFSDLQLQMRKVTFRNPDVLYFNKALGKLQFFQNSTNRTSITGKVSGPMNQLTGKNLVINTGEKTRLETDFNITGLPEMETATFNFPQLIIRSGKKDLMMMAGSSIPKSIELPEDIDLQIAFNGQMKDFETSLGLKSSFGAANLLASIDANENFDAKFRLTQLDIGRLLKDTLFYGPVSLTADAEGQGLNMNTIKGKIDAEVSQLYLNQYNYQHLTLNGTVHGKQFEGKIKLNDENAMFDFDGLVNLNTGQEKFKFTLNLLGADLQRLHFVENDVRISFMANADLSGGTVNQMNGTAGITNIVVAHENKTYLLESFFSASVNEPNKSEFNINSALIGMKYAGTISPLSLPDVLTRFINNYFPVSDSIPPASSNKPSNFNFEIQLHNHPILADLLLPGLNEFVPGNIRGSFDSEMNKLTLDANILKIVYGSTEIKDFTIAVTSDSSALNFNISTQNISNTQMNVSNLLIDGKIRNNQLTTAISSIDEKLYNKILIRSLITKEHGNYRLALNPADFYLMNKQWNIAADHYIEFGKEGFLVHNMNMNNAESQISVASVNDRFNDDLNIEINNFELSDLSGIVTKDSALVSGIINGTALLKRVNKSYGLVADAGISNLLISNIPIGNLSVKAENTKVERFNIDVNLSGAENKLNANGFYIPNGGANSINIKTLVESLSMKTLEAFSMGQIAEASGMLSGDFLVSGNTDAPGITGQMVFINAFLKPAFLNNRIELKHESIQLKDDGIYFDQFTLTDSEQNTAILNGVVRMNKFRNFNFNINLSSNDFLLFNTTVADNDVFFGRMIIDSKIDVTGPLALPLVKARLKMKKGSSFTFVVPEDQLTTDKGEDVVEFNTGLQLNPILLRAQQAELQQSAIKGFDVSSIIEIDKAATLRLLMDPASTDSLVVKGEAALSFTMDPSGQMSLTGAYNLNEGSYLVSLESIIKKQFDIDGGSTIIWNGDPLDANININARHTVRASPYDLVADQLTGLSDVEIGGYKQRYPFMVVLKLRGKILQPEISFEIELNPENQGIMGGSVQQKLSLLNEDPSGLNKQVFALLVLGRFIQENPFQSELGGPSAMIRTTVGKFLSAQLNQLSSKIIPGVELNFDIQSYDDYQSGQAQGRTQVEIGLKKQMFNERLSVQIGGTVDVEGEEAKHNSTSDIASDVTVEYKLNKDGSFRLKGFRHDQYEGAIEGQLVETGVGLVYVRDFNRWRRLFKQTPDVAPKAP